MRIITFVLLFGILSLLVVGCGKKAELKEEGLLLTLNKERGWGGPVYDKKIEIYADGKIIVLVNGQTSPEDKLTKEELDDIKQLLLDKEVVNAFKKKKQPSSWGEDCGPASLVVYYADFKGHVSWCGSLSGLPDAFPKLIKNIGELSSD